MSKGFSNYTLNDIYIMIRSYGIRRELPFKYASKIFDMSYNDIKDMQGSRRKAPIDFSIRIIEILEYLSQVGKVHK